MEVNYNVVYTVKSFYHLLMMTLDLQSSSFPQLLGKHMIDLRLLADDLVIEFLFMDLQEIAINLIFFDIPPHRVFIGYWEIWHGRAPLLKLLLSLFLIFRGFEVDSDRFLLFHKSNLYNQLLILLLIKRILHIYFPVRSPTPTSPSDYLYSDRLIVNINEIYNLAN